MPDDRADALALEFLDPGDRPEGNRPLPERDGGDGRRVLDAEETPSRGCGLPFAQASLDPIAWAHEVLPALARPSRTTPSGGAMPRPTDVL